MTLEGVEDGFKMKSLNIRLRLVTYTQKYVKI